MFGAFLDILVSVVFESANPEFRLGFQQMMEMSESEVSHSPCVDILAGRKG